MVTKWEHKFQTVNMTIFDDPSTERPSFTDNGHSDEETGEDDTGWQEDNH